MATVLRKTLPLCTDFAAGINGLKTQMGAQATYATGTFTLSASSAATVANAAFNAGTVLTIALVTFGGTALSVGLKQTATAGQVVVQGLTSAGANATTDQSVYAYIATTPVYHLDVYEKTSVAAVASDLPTSITLCNELLALYGFHLADGLAHKPAGVPGVALASTALVIDLPTVIAAANDIKAKFNVHIASAALHYTVDAANTIATANATDLASSITLLNVIQTKLNAHMASGSPGASIRLVNA